MALNIIILAAGRGKRMRSAVPKVLHRLAGRTLLEWLVRAVQPLNPAAIYVVYGHEGEQVRTQLAHLNLHWVEQVEQSGTGHAVAQVLPHLSPSDDVLILPGDVPLISTDTLQQLLITTPHRGLGIITAEVRDPSGLGRIIRDEAGQVSGIVEDADATPEQLQIREINSAILTTSVALLQQWIPRIGNHNKQQEYYLPSIVPLAVAEQCSVVSVIAAEEEVQGINDRSQLAALERYVQRTTAKKLMLSGVTVADPDRLDVRGELHAAQDVEIDINVIFEGSVTIGTGARIGANSIIRNSRIGNNVEIRPNSIIDGADIGHDCVIGPFARIRPDTQLAEKVHIGNFVEIKKTKISSGSKANHLSYLGDADIGSGVNIGAGTITCNYDGVNKHKTIISDKVFVGSNTALVAPVEIGFGVTIGAGSTITKSVPDDALAVSRSEQKNIKGWRRKK